MDDSGPFGIAGIQGSHPVHKGIYESTGSIPRAAMTYKAGGLVDYGQIAVFEQYIQGNFLWLRLIRAWRRHIQNNMIMKLGQISCFYLPLIDANVSFPNPILDLGTAFAGNPCEQKLIQANCKGVRRYDPRLNCGVQL